MALWAFAELLLETRGLRFDLSLDHLPSNLVAHDASEAFEFRELGISGKAVGIDLSPELASDPTQF